MVRGGGGGGGGSGVGGGVGEGGDGGGGAAVLERIVIVLWGAKNCILSFVFTLLSIRVPCVLCCLLIVFSFHLGEAGAVCNGLERETGGWCLLWSPA